LQIEDHFEVFPYDSDIETYVETELTAWASVRDNVGGMEANERNFGRFLNAGEIQSKIRQRIALALGFDLNYLGFGQTVMLRG
jgi:hypothetical protein